MNTTWRFFYDYYVYETVQFINAHLILILPDSLTFIAFFLKILRHIILLISGYLGYDPNLGLKFSYIN